jgi:hypothetical protein
LRDLFFSAEVTQDPESVRPSPANYQKLWGCDPRYQVVRFAIVDPDAPVTGSVALFYEQAVALANEFHAPHGATEVDMDSRGA